MTIQETLVEFLREQKTRGNADKTIFYYKQQVGYFSNFLKNKKIGNITYKDYQDYVIFLRNNSKLSSSTIRTYCRAVKVFLTYCSKENYISEDISSKLKLPKQLKKQIKILSYEDIEKILQANLSLRDMIAISFMLDCGLRISEVAGLKKQDIFFDKNLILVNGKGAKQRYVPLSDFTKALLLDYKLKDGLVLNMSINCISCMIKRLSKKIDVKIYPHLLRHTFATLFIVNGGDSLSLKNILGHTSFYMVDNYCHLANSIFIAENRKYAPLKTKTN